MMSALVFIASVVITVGLLFIGGLVFLSLFWVCAWIDSEIERICNR